MIYGTLGSEDSNHALVLRRYLNDRNVSDGQVRYFDEFLSAFATLDEGRIDFCLQVSVHPQHAECVARYVNRVFIVDTFIAASKPLGIVSRADVSDPQTIALQPATRHYADLSLWPTQIEEASITTVADGLLSKRYDSGIVALELCERYPGRFRIDVEIGPIEDAWILFANKPARKRPLLP